MGIQCVLVLVGVVLRPIRCPVPGTVESRKMKRVTPPHPTLQRGMEKSSSNPKYENIYFCSDYSELTSELKKNVFLNR